MDIAALVAEIDAEIACLEKAKTLLAGQTVTSKGRHPSTTRTKARAASFAFGNNAAAPKRKMSAEGRARIAAAQKARWARAKKA